MKKILILTYFYPPANFVGGQRVASWAKYLHEFGYYPIIVTRHWNDGQTDLVDKVENNKLEIEYNQTHEVHRLPFRTSLRDRCAAHKWLKPVQKALTLWELIASNFFISALPFANFYEYTKNVLEAYGDVDILIASGRPFQLFAIGHQLKKDFPDLMWLPDYRDEWNSFQSNKNKSTLKKVLNLLESRSEVAWTSSVRGFFTVSDFGRHRISKLIAASGHTIMNGFEQEITPQFANTNTDFNKIEISYIGTLYSYQPIELFIEETKKIILANNSKIKIKVNFIGINVLPDQVERIKKLIVGFEESFFIFERMSFEELQKYYENSDFLLATSYENIKGWCPVKIFEYAISGKPIMLFPSDNDVIQKFIEETNSGLVIKNENEFRNTLNSVFEAKIKNKQMSFELKNLDKYSRKHQASMLAEALNFWTK